MLTPDDATSDWIEAYSTDNKFEKFKGLPSWITEEQILEQEYERIPGEFESPEDVAAKAFAAGAERVVFRIEENSQFYTVFHAYQLQPYEDKE